MGAFLKAGTIVLPAPTALTVDDEIIWSSDTGRTMDGTMVGDPVAEKKTASFTWEFLEESEVALIKRCLTSGFYPVTFRDDGIDITIEVYRGTLSKVHAGWIGNEYWYKSASVKLVER